jgi:hypothetical protein
VLLAAREAWILLETSESPYSRHLNGRAPGRTESSVKATAANNQTRQLQVVVVYWQASQSDEMSAQLDSVCYTNRVCEQWLGTAGK